MKSSGHAARPLVVSLHAWSSGYDEKDSLSWQCLDKNYNYIHPHFRGPNWTYEACGSPLAIGDIDDAIAYAIANSNVDTNEIHIIGGSGGGYATLLAYMNTKYPVRTFSAWVPITNLVDWFYETKSREPKHSLDIARATTGKNFDQRYYQIDEKQAKLRSPTFMPTPVQRRKSSKLFIYAGIHDGYNGSVPITHSINMYNKIVSDFDISAKGDQVGADEIIRLVTHRRSMSPQNDSIGDRVIHYQATYQDKLQLTLFEGAHESLTNVLLDHINRKRILTIGDSNGAFDFGWVRQLEELPFTNEVFNVSIAGNTIGFDNNGDAKFNTLKNIGRYLDQALDAEHGIDAVVIMLGTNDCKTDFADSLSAAPERLRMVINKIRQHALLKEHSPVIYIASPPPMGDPEKLERDFHGAPKRLEYLIPKLKQVALSEECIFIDTYSPLKGIVHLFSPDGIHFNAEGQEMLARIISEALAIHP